eukprot:GDKJ01019037.1.p1 GENE.GDKJ01019037.1~~GDKJ01019037.1.p1  ORF type:complete len:250 (+),score=42.91 GDKJ01019037.1:134-883(+)
MRSSQDMYLPFIQMRFSFLLPIALACDLKISVNDLELDTVRVTKDNCLRRCTNGEGERKVLKFSTLIENIGKSDCEFGSLPKCTGQEKENAKVGPFSFDKCRDGWTIADFYTVSLLNSKKETLASQKNPGTCIMDGFCAADSVPDSYFSCTRQGIHKGCSDSTERSMPCQWIDVTDLIGNPKGEESLTLKVSVDEKGQVSKDNNLTNNVYTVENVILKNLTQETPSGVNFFPLSMCSTVSVDEAFDPKI